MGSSLPLFCCVTLLLLCAFASAQDLRIRVSFAVVGQVDGVELATPTAGNITAAQNDICSGDRGVDTTSVDVPFSFSYNGATWVIPLSDVMPQLGIRMLLRTPIAVETISASNTAVRSAVNQPSQRYLVNFTLTIVSLPGFSFDITFSNPATQSQVAMGSGFGVYSLSPRYDLSCPIVPTTTTTQPATTTVGPGTTTPTATTDAPPATTTTYPYEPDPPLDLPPIDTLNLSGCHAVRPFSLWTTIAALF